MRIENGRTFSFLELNLQFVTQLFQILKKKLYNIKILMSVLFSPFEITIRIQKQSEELADHTLNINGLNCTWPNINRYYLLHTQQ